MKNALLMLFCFTTFSGLAQEEKKYKTLVKDLNKMLKAAEEFSWMYASGFEVVQPYKVD